MLRAGKNFHFIAMHNLLFFYKIDFSNSRKMIYFCLNYTAQIHIVRKLLFCETLSSTITEASVSSKVTFPNFKLCCILSLWIFVDIHKTRGYIMAISEFLFDPALLPPAIRYDKLFENLPRLEERHAETGRR